MAHSPFDRDHQHGDVDNKIVAVLDRLSQAFRQLLWETAQAEQLTPLQIHVLINLLVREDSRLSPSELARLTGVSPPTMSDAIAALDSKQLISRKADPDDRRAMRLYLTTKGRKLAGRVAHWADSVRDSLTGSEKEDKQRALSVLMEIAVSLQHKGIININRMCYSCTYFKPKGGNSDKAPHFCALLEVPLAPSELRVDCEDYEPV